jgi:hypothetical protein
MKFILKSLTFVTFLLLVISCSSDSAPGGSTPCVPITCLNGGVSTPSCGCTCPQGFSGANCSTQITPSKITVTKIRVKKFPNLKPNGNNWDTFVLPGFERPDIYPELANFDGTTILFTGTPIDDSFSYGNDTFDFIPTTPIIITNLTNQYRLVLNDKDANNTFETMGGFTINLYSSTGGFPTTIPISNPTSLYGFELTVTYTW